MLVPHPVTWQRSGFIQTVEHILLPEVQRTIYRLLSLAAGLLVSLVLCAGVPAGELGSDQIQKLAVVPPHVELDGLQDQSRLLVDGNSQDGRRFDFTRRARFTSEDEQIATVSPDGVVRGVADGETTVVATVDDHMVRVPVKIRGTQTPREFHFENDIIPLLTRYGCNTSGCHGKAEGQNGFKLSVFGFQPEADHAALTKEQRGRRLSQSIPEQSLLLTKASGGVAHGGGIRLKRGSGDYRTLRDWIVAGAPLGSADAPKVTKIEVTPHERLMGMQAQQQLRVVATYSDGRQCDVTAHAKFQSNNDALGNVNEFGLVTTGELPGEVAIMASYMGAVDIFLALIPRPDKIQDYPEVEERNFIDPLVHAKLRKLNIVPSAQADDATFMRRVYLDIIGTLPTAAEAREFLSDDRPDRRSLLVERLLQRPEYADYQALKWADLLRVDRLALGHKGAYQYYQWIRNGFQKNKPFDELATELLTAAGPVQDAPAAQFYKVAGDAHKRAATFSQVFLGVRIECAQCHHHPTDRWSQTDYFGMHAFFTQVGFQKSKWGEALTVQGTEKSVHPRTGTEVFAHPLATKNPTTQPSGDRREILARWLTANSNPWFARNIANRAWAHFMGRGLVEPIDDFRLTNPPSNPQLLDALAADFVDNGYDYRNLTRTIVASAAYQRSTDVNSTNQRDEQNYSRFLLKRLDAEVLFDAIVQTTGVPEKFAGVADGYRAIQLWDSQVPHYFLKTFGRPLRVTACSCERSFSPTVGQVLHVLNSPEIQEKLSHEGGRVARLVRTIDDDAALVEELTLTCFGRYPSGAEKEKLAAHLQGKSGQQRRKAAEDVVWSLMNSMEFLFNH